MPLSVDHVCQFKSKSVHSFSNNRVIKFGNRQTNRRTDFNEQAYTVRYTVSVDTDLHSTVSFLVTLGDLAKYSMTRSITRPFCDSRATCCISFHIVRENVCNKAKQRTKSRFLWILKKNIKNVKVMSCTLKFTQSVCPVSVSIKLLGHILINNFI